MIKEVFIALIGISVWEVLRRFFLKIKQNFYKKSFKGIFGLDSLNDFFLVYGRVKPQPSDKWTHYKQYQPSVAGFFKISSAVPFPETKAISYLLEAFYRVGVAIPTIISDEEEKIKDKLDVSFCSVGGYDNLKTIDLLEGEGNPFFSFDISQKTAQPGIIIKEGNKDAEKKFSIDGKYDYAVIIKIIPKNFKNRVWISVAGLGEWGTSGATWFLSKKWKSLPKNKPFGLIIRVQGGKDESAEIVYKSIKNNDF